MDITPKVLMYRIRKTVLQMLRDRGYVVSSKKLKQTIKEFEESYTG
jgi:hypothetical protein